MRRRIAVRLIVCAALGLAAAFGVSEFLAWCSRLPRVSEVSLANSYESSNTASTAICVFSFVFVCGAIVVLLSEFRRNAFAELQRAQHRWRNDQ